MKFRTDIEGLRALAVVVVVLCHLNISGFEGGYIGVDIFFVISGYLITNMLSLEYQKNYQSNNGYGWISLRAFYFRRAKRILPASILVLSVTTCFSYVVFNFVRFREILQDTFWSAAFLANLHFIRVEVDYFKSGFSISPLQHYWSLAVEEQYYLVFPVLFVIATKFHGLKIGRIQSTWKTRLIALLSLVTITSLIWSVYSTYSKPEIAYFSSLSRAWEIGLGALVALLKISSSIPFSKRPRMIISSVGLIFIVFSVVTFDERSRIPGILSLLPTLGAVLIIVAGENSEEQFGVNYLLSNIFFGFIGRISYSIYLWHLPVITFANFLQSENMNKLEFRLLIMICILILSILSYYLVERPFRKIEIPNNFSLEPRRRIFYEPQWKKLKYVSLFTLISMVCALLSLVIIDSQKHSASRETTTKSSSTNQSVEKQIVVNPTKASTANEKKLSPTVLNPIPTGISISSEEISKYRQRLKESLQIKLLPDNLDPALEFLYEGAWTKSHIQWNCNGNAEKHSNDCSLINSSSDKRILVIGDSHAVMTWQILAQTYMQVSSLYFINMSSCPIADVPAIYSRRECTAFRETLASKVERINPDVLILSDYSASLPPALLEKGLTAAVTRYKKFAKNVVIFGENPTQESSMKDCIGSQNRLTSSCFGIQSKTDGIRNVQREVSRKTGVNYFDPVELFCHEGSCPPIVGNTIVRWDTNHITENFAVLIAPLVRLYLHDLLPSIL